MQTFRTPNKTNVVLMDYMLPAHRIPEASRPMQQELKARIEAFIGAQLTNTIASRYSAWWSYCTAM